MCCSGAKWKREVVPDHKFHFVDIAQFHDESCFTRLRYVWEYVLVIKSFLVYVADAYTAISMLASNHWSGQLLKSDASDTMKIPFSIGKWIFTGCIIFSFLLLAWEARKSKRIIKSGDISYAYTNIMANNYYSIKSYDHFCFFCQINNSRKVTDEFAFFVFFTFKGWKRLLLADAPRQVINGLTLYSFGKAYNFTTDWSQYVQGSWMVTGVLMTMIFTVVVWAGSFILLLIAAAMYVPLLCYIQGNLKEYCCHKIDKRIAELIKKKHRKRLLKEREQMRKEAEGDYSSSKGKKNAPMAQPTLPKIDFDDDRWAGSDVGSTHKDASYFNRTPGTAHMYPPSSGWSSQGYGFQEKGYEPSIHSLDKAYYDNTPSDQPYVPPYAPALSKAPSYRSQTSLHDQARDGVWQNDSKAPPTPAVPDVYNSLDQHLRQPTPQADANSYRGTGADEHASAYQQPSRQRLLDNVNQQQERDQFDTYSSAHSVTATPAYYHHQQSSLDRRPESELVDLEAYYSASAHGQDSAAGSFNHFHQQSPPRR